MVTLHFADGCRTRTLPNYEEIEDDIADLVPNLEDARIGLAVPEYMDIDSIEDLQD